MIQDCGKIAVNADYKSADQVKKGSLWLIFEIDGGLGRNRTADTCLFRARITPRFSTSKTATKPSDFSKKRKLARALFAKALQTLKSNLTYIDGYSWICRCGEIAVKLLRRFSPISSDGARAFYPEPSTTFKIISRPLGAGIVPGGWASLHPMRGALATT